MNLYFYLTASIVSGVLGVVAALPRLVERVAPWLFAWAVFRQDPAKLKDVAEVARAIRASDPPSWRRLVGARRADPPQIEQSEPPAS